MLNIYLPRPEWFFGVDTTLEAFAGIIALLIAFVSYKLYRSTNERSYKYFLASFVLLGGSFLSRSVADAFLGKFFNVSPNIIGLVFFGGYVGHIFLALAAYLLLIASTYKIEDKRLLVMMFLLLVPGLVFSASYFLSFYVLSSILLLFITWAYSQNYRKVRSVTSALVFGAFILLTLAQPLFILDMRSNIWYVFAHAVQAFAYLMLLAALLRILLKR
ncbi:hypothetical protein J4211_00010 [Candidatus Woesearchaeota archaeon]|nr:hypothetical protein [Candidatus Woesearchaeota archaeon]